MTAVARPHKSVAAPAPAERGAHVINNHSRLAIKHAVEQARKWSKKKVHVPAHDRKILLLDEQIRKDRAIEGGAHILNTFSHLGVNERDRGHLRRFIQLLREVGGV
jgi:hypothetical protein